MAKKKIYIFYVFFICLYSASVHVCIRIRPYKSCVESIIGIFLPSMFEVAVMIKQILTQGEYSNPL